MDKNVNLIKQKLSFTIMGTEKMIDVVYVPSKSERKKMKMKSAR